VRIYLAPCAADAVSAPVLPAVPATGGAETILVVEDETEVRTTTVDLLLALGYRVLQAEDARAGIEIVQSGAVIDLVFTDVIMPGQLTSFDLAQTVQRTMPGTPVLFTSGYAEGVLAHEGRIDPSVNLLPKPYQADALASRIRQLLQLRTPAVAA
jgi:CheY-like chemotaxis protein